MTTRPTRRASAALLATAILMTFGCGTRLSHTQIVTTAGSPAGLAPSTTGGLAPGTDGTTGTSDPVGSSPPSGSTSGTTGSGAATSGRTTGVGTGGSSTGATSSGGGGSKSGSPIVIGSVGTFSGIGSSAVQQGPAALKAWVASINARGGINGRQVKVIVLDDAADSARSLSEVKDLVENYKVVALVSTYASTASTQGWRSYVEQKKVPVIGGNCVADLWNQSPVFFSQCASFNSTLYGLALLGAKNAKGPKFGGLFCAEDSACTTAQDRLINQGFAKRAGLDPVYSASISVTQPDFTAECLQARNAGVQLLSVASDDLTARRVQSSCLRQGYTPQYLVFGPTATTSLPSYLPDVIAALPVFPFVGATSPAGKEFNATWKKYSKEDPGGNASGSWAAAKIFETAARATKDVTRSELIQALYGFKASNFGGLTVPLSYGPKGTADSHCIFLLRGIGGKWTAPQGDKPTCW